MDGVALLWLPLIFALGVDGCSFPRSVDFEDCLYADNHAASSGFDWSAQSAGPFTAWHRRQGTTRRTGSVKDHTRQATHGNFMAVVRATANGSFTSPIERDLTSAVYAPPETTVCSMSFWLRASGTTVVDLLNVYMSPINADNSRGPLQLLIKRSVLTNTDWELFSAPLTTTSRFELIFRSSMRPSTVRTEDYMAIDDVAFSTDCCQDCTVVPRIDMECGLQGYSLAPSGAAPWSLRHRGSGSIFTGPARDNTFAGTRGHYLQVDSIKQKNARSIFQSPEYKATATSGQCNVSFAYHMKGAGIGSLSVVLRTVSSHVERTLWSRSGAQGDDWLNTAITYTSNEKYQILFVAQTTSDSRGDIALDDISYSTGCCVGYDETIPALETCRTVGYDTRVDRRLRDRSQAQFIDELMAFECNGTVLGWKLHTSGACSYSMKIWRAVDSVANTFFLVGQETVAISGAGQQQVRSPTQSLLQFERGDVVGWEHLSGNGHIIGSDTASGEIRFNSPSQMTVVSVGNRKAYRLSGLTGQNLFYSIMAMVHSHGATDVPTFPSPSPLTVASSTVFSSSGLSSKTITDSMSRIPVSTAATAGTPSNMDSSDPVYPWVIVGLVLMAFVLLTAIGLVCYVRTHSHRRKQNLSPAHRRQAGGNMPSHNRLTNTSSFNNAMRLPVGNGSPVHHAGSGVQYPATPAMLDLSRPTLACETRLPSPGFINVPTPSVVKAFPGMSVNATVAAASYARVHEYAETLPEPTDSASFSRLPEYAVTLPELTDSSVAAASFSRLPEYAVTLPELTDSSVAAASFARLPKYADTSPELTDSLMANTTQDNSLDDSHDNSLLASALHSRQASGLTEYMSAAACHGDLGDMTSSSDANETPSKKSDNTNYTMESHCRSQSDTFGTRSMSGSRPHSRSEAFTHRSVDSPFRASGNRRTPYAEPHDAIIGKMRKPSYPGPRYSSPYQEPAVTVPGIFAQLKNGKCIQREKIDVQAMIEHGHQCAVYAGVWKKGSVDVPVAVKTVYPKKEGDYMPFLREATILGQFSHRNIVTLFGVVMDDSGKAPQLILELMSDSLKPYLISLRPAGMNLPELADEHVSEQQLNMCCDIASGMAYLEQKGFVHRDLAAKNIMIGSDRVCKIGDFSMCRDMAAPDSMAQSKNVQVPAKWASPEVLKHYKFTAASDVWSYGVLLYEVWSLGLEPYDGLDNDKVLEHIDSGNRLPSPAKCPLAMYEIMMDCWHPFSMERPSFQQLVRIIEMTDRNILLGQITLPIDTLIYDDAEDMQEGNVDDFSRLTPAERLQRRYANFHHGEMSPKYIVPDDKRMMPFSRQGSTKLTSLPRHMLAEQLSNYSHASIETGSSSVTSV